MSVRRTAGYLLAFAGAALAVVGIVVVVQYVCVAGTLSHPAESTTTGWDARRNIISHVQTVADSLPPGAVLSTTLAGKSNSHLGAGGLPADEDHGNPDQAYSYTLDYWVVLPADAGLSGTMAFDRVVAAWRTHGVPVRIRDDQVAVATTEDGYTLVAEVVWQDELTIAAQSPTFPHSQFDDEHGWPSLFISDGVR